MTFPLQHQGEIFSLLAAFWNGGRFPHALLFEGPVGSGKRTAAQYAAAMLLCRDETAQPPCDVCPSCHKLKSGNHPDFTILLPEGKSKTIGVEQVRFIKSAAYISPHESQRKVFFIPEAQKLRIEAQNALLKLIEEPPESAYFIFTAPSRSNLLETVCSRLTILSMQELSETQRLDVLKPRLPDEDPALLSAQAALCPTVGQALDSICDPVTRQCSDDAAAILQALTHCDRYTVLKLLSGYEKDREHFSLLLTALRTAVITQLTDGTRALSPLQSAKIVDIIDETALRSTQNVGIALISAAAVNRLVNAVGSI